jgi:flagella synthesis protein FlgN
MSDQMLNNLIMEHAESVELLKILGFEQIALTNNNLEALVEMRAAKESSLSTIISITSNRHKHMASAGFELSADGAAAWITSWSSGEKTLVASIKANDVLRALIETTRSAKEQNRINGLLISRNAVSNNQTLRVLNAGRKSTEVYGSDGQTKTTRAPRTLVVG